MLRHAIDATARLRSDLPASDEIIRRWPIIPDEYDVRRHEVVIRIDCGSGVGANAAYINVAAHQGSAWVTTPREPEPCMMYSAARRFGVGGGFATDRSPYTSPLGSPDPGGRPNPAIEPPLGNPLPH